jgi:hypothetical protein
VTGIEPAPSVWKTEALPLSYTRDVVRNRSILWDRLGEVVEANLFASIHRGVA